MRAWAGAAVSVIALVFVIPVTVAESSGDEVVARLPREGDMARYEFNGTVLGLCGGQVWQTNHRATLMQDDATLRWTLQERQMWDGQTYGFAALERTFDGQGCDDYDSTVEYLVALSAELYGQLPGPSFALNTANQHLYDHQYGPTYIVAGVDELHLHGSGCGGRAIGLVLGKTAPQAHEALRACIGEDGFGDSIATGWEDDPTYGRTWVARFEAIRGDAPTLLLRYSPEASMPVENRSTIHRLADGRIIEENATMKLTGWIDGEEPLAPMLGGTPALPSVPLIEWGMHGPSTGDLEPFPVREAREALAETERGAQYFGAHPEASLQYARYSPEYPATDGTLHPGNGPTEEVDCQKRGAGEQTGAAHAGAADVRWLRTRWADGTGYLYGHTHAPGMFLDAGIAAAYSDERRMETGRDEAGSPDRGPRWHDLLAAEELVKNMGASGRLVVTVTTSSLPTPAWDAGTSVHFQPWLPTHGEAFTGTVGLSSWCTTADWIVGIDQGLAFVDGRLAYAWAMTSDATYSPVAPLPAWEHPATAFEAGGGGTNWFQTAWVGAAAGLGILGLIAVAIKTGLGERIAVSLFSRFQPGELAAHPLRSRILTQVKAQPGIRLPALADTLGNPRPTLSYHIRMLERHDLVRVSRTWRGLVLHPKGHAGTTTAGVLNRANAREVLELIDRRPASDVSSVAAELGVHKSRISRLSQDLEVAGLIERRSAGRGVQLLLSNRGRDLLKSSNPQRHQRPSGA